MFGASEDDCGVGTDAALRAALEVTQGKGGHPCPLLGQPHFGNPHPLKRKQALGLHPERFGPRAALHLEDILQKKW